MLFLKISGGFLLFIALLLLGLRIRGKSPQRFEGAPPELSCWMQKIRDDALLRQTAIPGSHDAGTRGLIWAGETQTYTVTQQLLSGSRYFDLRVHKKGEEYRIFHSILDGIAFSQVLTEIKDFLLSHPSEILLLDFQHFKDSQDKVKQMLWQELGTQELLVVNRTGLSPVEFIRRLTVGEARGKCVIFWGDRSETGSDFLFLRNDNECTFDGMCMDSYFYGPYHKRDTACLLEKAHPLYFQHLEALRQREQNAAFVLQCQLTDGLVVRGPWQRNKNHDPMASSYIRALKDSPYLPDINVVMRDFITPEKCRDIIELNKCKGIMT